MFRKDFMMRAIEEMAKVMAVILGLRKQGRFEEAHTAVSEAYTEYFKDIHLQLLNLPPESMVTAAREEFKLEDEQLSMLAELMLEEGYILVELDRKEEARDKLRRSLLLFTDVNRAQAKVFSLHRNNKISEINSLLSALG